MWLYFVAVFFVCVFSEGEFALWIMFVRIDIDFFSLKKKIKERSKLIGGIFEFAAELLGPAPL